MSKKPKLLMWRGEYLGVTFDVMEENETDAKKKVFDEFIKKLNTTVKPKTP